MSAQQKQQQTKKGEHTGSPLQANANRDAVIPTERSDEGSRKTTTRYLPCGRYDKYDENVRADQYVCPTKQQQYNNWANTPVRPYKQTEIMAKKQPKNNEYRQKNEAFIQALRDGEEELLEISQGVLVKILKSGDGDRCPRSGNVVTVNYKGSFINGRVFDSSYERGYPEAFRLSDLIVGWQIALTQMKVGDHWIVYIPWEVGYGSRANGPIPAYSTLIFEMELVAIM